MGKIFYIMGKSASGKDKLYGLLMNKAELNLKRWVLYTTRPIRLGEKNGREYYFTSHEILEKMRKEGRVIEERTYDTVAGPWTYFTAADDTRDLENHDYLGIGTLESFVKMKNYFGERQVVPLYIDTDDGIRLQRAIKREAKQEKPNYQEVCRRFLADSEDFSEEHIRAAGIHRIFDNSGELEACLAELEEYISAMV